MKLLKSVARSVLGIALGYAGFTHLTSSRLEFQPVLVAWALWATRVKPAKKLELA